VAQFWKLHSRVAHRGLRALALLAVGLRVLLPTGYMLEPHAGQLRLVICPAAGHVPDMAGMHHAPGLVSGGMPGAAPDAGHASHHRLAAVASCPFALSGGALLATQALKTTDLWFVVLRPAAPPPLISLPAAPPLRHQAARGPPALV
jgi:hypothetical protein